ESLEEMTEAISAKTRNGSDLKKAAVDVIREAIVQTKAIRFEGNNYSDEWRVEAEHRDLPNLRKTPESLAWLVRPESVEFFSRMGIFNHEENEARYHVKLERYVKDIEIEVEVLKDLATTYVLPAAIRQQILLSEGIRNYVEAARVSGIDSRWANTQAQELNH